MFFTPLMNTLILLLNEYFLFKNHWNTVLMNIIIYFLMNMWWYLLEMMYL
jgi:hypothetical protein